MCLTGKRCYDSKAEAKQAKRRVKAAGIDISRGLGWYKCSICGSYHLGNRHKRTA